MISWIGHDIIVRNVMTTIDLMNLETYSCHCFHGAKFLVKKLSIEEFWADCCVKYCDELVEYAVVVLREDSSNDLIGFYCPEHKDFVVNLGMDSLATASVN